VDGLTPAMSEGSAARGAVIPLDLASPLMQYRETSGLSIRVERLPFKARLSQGRNNGDNSWSLTIDELDGLRYLPPEGLTAAHTLTVRVIRIADDSASTLMRFDVPVSPGGSRSAPAPAPAPSPPPPSPPPPSAAPAPAAPAPAAAPIAARPAPAADRRSVEERADWAAEQQDRVAAAVQNAVQRVEAGAKAQIDQTNEARLASEVERRVREARASWEAEQEGRVDAALRDAVRQAEADARVQIDQSTEVRLSMELDKRLEEERAAWDAEQKRRVAAAAQEAAQRAEADAIAQMEHANEARIAEVVERRLYEARMSWEDEHQEQMAEAVRDAVHRAEADIRAQLDKAGEARLTYELEHRLGEARASWEAELHGRVATAVRDALEKSEMDARIRFERAQQDWRDASAREIADMSARCADAEAALAEALSRPASKPENELEIRGLNAELATVQAVVRAREAEIADLRQTLDRAMAEMPGRAIEAEANIERGRAAWHAEREDLLTRSEENAQLRVKQALERWQQETKELLNKAKQEWAEGEASRLVLAEAKWRENLGIAKSRAPIAQLTKKRSRIRLVGRFKQVAVVAAILTGAYMLYPRVEPLLASSVWPTITSYKNKIEPTINKMTRDLKAWMLRMEKRGEAIRKKKKEPRR